MFKKIYSDLLNLKWYEYLFIVISGLFLVISSLINLTESVRGHKVIWSWEGLVQWKGAMQIIAGVAAFTGIVCVFLVGKGKISNYFWGTINALTYGLFAFSVGYTGDAMLNLLWFLPTQFVGLIMWKQHLQKDHATVKANKLTIKHIGIYTLVTLLLFGAFWIIIPGVDVELNKNVLNQEDYDYAFRHKYVPRVFDSATNAFSITAQILMLKRFKEQWYLWIVVNILQITMYAGINGWGVNIPMIIMWSIFLLNAIYSVINWYKLEKIGYEKDKGIAEAI